MWPKAESTITSDKRLSLVRFYKSLDNFESKVTVHKAAPRLLHVSGKHLPGVGGGVQKRGMIQSIRGGTPLCPASVRKKGVDVF